MQSSLLETEGSKRWSQSTRTAPAQGQLNNIAARLKALREAMRMSAAEICRTADIRPNTWSQWENARQRPQIDEAMRLCVATGAEDPIGLTKSVQIANDAVRAAYAEVVDRLAADPADLL